MTLQLPAPAPTTRRANSGVLILETFLRMGCGFAVSVLLAHELGPEGLGLITTANSAVAIAMGFSALGLSGVLIRELVENVERRGQVMLTVTLAKFVAGGVLLAALLVALRSLDDRPELQTLTLVIGLGFLMSSLDSVECLYNASEEFVRLVVLRLIALGASTAIKVFAITQGWSLVFVAAGYALDYALLYVLPTVDLLCRREGGVRSGGVRLGIDTRALGRLLRRSWPVFVSGGFAQVNLKIDTLMIAGLASIADVGIYAAASRLSEAWSLLAMAIVASSFPVLVRLKRMDTAAYARELSQLLRRLIWVSLAGAVVISILAGHIIRLLYGPSFAAAGQVLAIHVFAGVFLFLRTAVSRWLILEDLLMFSLVSHIAGALVNVTLNLVLIPRMGIQGAAWASLASYAMSGFLFLLLSRRSRPMFSLIAWSALPAKYSVQPVERLGARMAEARST